MSGGKTGAWLEKVTLGQGCPGEVPISLEQVGQFHEISPNFGGQGYGLHVLRVAFVGI